MMINYIFIVLAVACFAAQFAFTKLYQKNVGQAMSSTLVMLTGISLVGALIFASVAGFRIAFSPISICWASLFAVIMIPYYMIGIKVLSLGSLAIYSMFMMLGGMLVPFFYGVIILHEPINIAKILGTVLLVCFIILQAAGQNVAHEKKPLKGKKYVVFALCLAIFFINGMTGVITKTHSISAGAVDAVSFTVISCTTTAFLSLIVLGACCHQNKNQSKIVIKSALKGKAMLIVALQGGVAYGGSYLMLLAASKVPASVQFPLVSGGVFVLSAIVSLCVFKEKISKLELCSVLGAFASTFLFAL